MVLRVEFEENCSNKILLIVLLSMGDFMKKGIFEWAILIWTSLLVLLITGWIMIEFYDWKDTIVAAIIAFVGAIIGGSITLIGVKQTIKENRRENNEKNLPRKIVNANHFVGQLKKIVKVVNLNIGAMNGDFLKVNLSRFNTVDSVEAFRDVKSKIKDFIDNAINDTALEVSFEVYESVIDFSDKFEEINAEIEEIVSENNLNVILGKKNEDYTITKLKNGVAKYLVIIDELITIVEKEKKTNQETYRANKTS